MSVSIPVSQEVSEIEACIKLRNKFLKCRIDNALINKVPVDCSYYKKQMKEFCSQALKMDTFKIFYLN